MMILHSSQQSLKTPGTKKGIYKRCFADFTWSNLGSYETHDLIFIVLGQYLIHLYNRLRRKF